MKVRITEEKLKTIIQESLKKEIMLIEQVRTEINNFITEDYSVNNAFDEELTNAISIVTKQLNGSKFIKGGDDVNRKVVRGNLTLNGKTVKYEITNYWFNNEEEYEEFANYHITPQGYISTLNTVFVPLFSVGKDFSYEDFCDTFYHEAEHAFQDIMGGVVTVPSKKYSIAISNIKSMDKVERAIAEIFYLSDRKEQDAFVNGLWGYVSKSKNFFSMNDKIKESEAFVWVKKLREDKEMLEKCENIDDYLKKYGKKREGFLNFTEKVIRSFERKIARVVFRLKKNKIISEGFRPHITPNDNLKQGQLFWI